MPFCMCEIVSMTFPSLWESSWYWEAEEPSQAKELLSFPLRWHVSCCFVTPFAKVSEATPLQKKQDRELDPPSPGACGYWN